MRVEGPRKCGSPLAASSVRVMSENETDQGSWRETSWGVAAHLTSSVGTGRSANWMLCCDVETVWPERFNGIARCRHRPAQKLVHAVTFRTTGGQHHRAGRVGHYL